MGWYKVTKKIDDFLDRITSIRLPDVFNPYSDICPTFDRENAAELRLNNLRSILYALKEEDIIDIWIGRDLGYRGGRRTGLALTDEVHMSMYAKHLRIHDFPRATVGPAVSERTAHNIHQVLKNLTTPVLTWNAFPLHPHLVNQPFTNRQHTRKEAVIGLEILKDLVEIFPVRQIVTIGNDACEAVKEFDVTKIKVRHPSYGGQSEFHEGMKLIYAAQEAQSAQLSLL